MQPLVRRIEAARRRRGLSRGLGKRGVDDLGVEAVLAAEMVADGRDVGSRPAGDFADGGAVVADLGKHGQAGVEQAETGLMPGDVFGHGPSESTRMRSGDS